MFFRQKPTQQTDAELISKFRQSGDLGLVSELFSRYTEMVYGVCLKYLKDREEAKDSTMLVFEKLPQALQHHEVTNFKSWLYVSARNQCLMQIRSKKGKLTQELTPDIMESGYQLHPEPEKELETDLQKLEKCMAELVDEQKRCVQLFFLEEQCYKDVARATGFDLNQVKSYIQNGKRNLTLCMERNGGR